LDKKKPAFITDRGPNPLYVEEGIVEDLSCYYMPKFAGSVPTLDIKQK